MGRQCMPPQRGSVGEEMPCMFFYPGCRTCNYMLLLQCFAQGIILIQGSMERSWLDLLQGWSSIKTTACSFALCRKQTRVPASILGILGADSSSARSSWLQNALGMLEDAGQQQGTHQAGSTILSLCRTPLRVMFPSHQMRAAIFICVKTSSQIPCVPASIQPHSKVHGRPWSVLNKHSFTLAECPMVLPYLDLPASLSPSQKMVPPEQHPFLHRFWVSAFHLTPWIPVRTKELMQS